MTSRLGGDGKTANIFFSVVSFTYLMQGWTHFRVCVKEMRPSTLYSRVSTFICKVMYNTVLRIRIRICWVHMILGLPDPHPDPLDRDTYLDPDPVPDLDPDASIIKQK